RLLSLAWFNGWLADAALPIAAGLEQGSEHPLAAAILAGARVTHVPRATGFESMPGFGVRATVDGVPAMIGNQAMLAQAGVAIEEALPQAEQWRQQAQTVVFLAINGQLAGLFGVADPVKSSAAAAIRQLRDEGVHVVMVTGDSVNTARVVARQVGI